MPDCGMCDGPLVPLGRLGRLTYYRCRNCGWEHRHDVRHDHCVHDPEEG